MLPSPPAPPTHRPRWRPPIDAMTGLRSTSRMSGPIHPEPAERHEHRRERRPVDGRVGRGRRRGAARRAARRASHSAPRGVDRREPDRDIVEELGQHATEADEHGRAELRVAAQADDQLDARGGHRLDQQAADGQATAAAPSRGASARRRRPRRRRASPRATPPTSVLWVSPTASSLSATGAIRSGGRPTRRSRHPERATTSVTAMPAPATSARLSRSDRATGWTRGRPGRARVGAVRRPIRGQAPASPVRHGPRSIRAACRPSQRATSAIARNASSAPRRSGAPCPDGHRAAPWSRAAARPR